MNIQTAHHVSLEILESLRKLDSCTVSNAVERLDVRSRSEGFANSSVRCLTPHLRPMVGYAVTGRMRCSVAPTTDHWYYDRLDWWKFLLTIPAPRVIVMEDVDEQPGLGALFGEVHASIARKLDCIGYVTNGTVRGMPQTGGMDLHLFASGVVVSHAYAHIAEFGHAVSVGGMAVKPGDVLHGDRHGVLTVPESIAARIPEAAARVRAAEEEIIHVCESPDFSPEKLHDHIERARNASML